MITNEIKNMKIEEKYDFRKRFDLIHTPDVVDVNVKPENDDFVFDHISFKFENEFSDVVKIASADFEDYMKTSMHVEKGGNANVILKLADDLGDYNSYKGYRIKVTDTVEISGYDERGIAQALYNLEDMLNLRRAPYLKKDTYFWKPMYAPMMTHSGYGFDAFPDSYLSRLAHEGRDTIMIFVKGINKTPHGDLDFNDVITRAARYGIDVYAYSNFTVYTNPKSENAEKDYEETYGKLFDACPGFKGLILCGESIMYTSEDPNTCDPAKFFVDGIPSHLPRPAWYPCSDYADWLKLVQKIVTRRNPNTDIVFWTYNLGRAPREKVNELVKSIPVGITLLITYEMGENVELENSLIYGADYTLSITGPSTIFEQDSKTAKERGIKLYTMSNSGGRTWDFGVVPYMPMPQQWIKRYKGMEKAYNEVGLCGNMECHHYGLAPSFITKLAKWAFSEPRIPYEKLLEDVIKLEFGKDYTEEIIKALDLLSESINYYTPTDGDQYGAFRVGPAYPFNIGNVLEIPIPFEQHATCKGTSMVFPNYFDYENGHGSSHIALRIHDEINSLEKMRELFKKGVELLDEIPNKNDKLLLLTNQCHYMLTAINTGINAKNWFIKFSEQKVCYDREKLIKTLDEMQEILDNERANVKEAITYVERDSSLGWEPSMEYIGEKWHLEWKLRELDCMELRELSKLKLAAKC